MQKMPALTMSSSAFSPSLVIDRPGCRRAQALVLCSVLLALAGIGSGGVTGWPQAIAMLLVAAGGVFELRRASPRSPRFVTRIVVTADGGFLLGRARDPDPASLAPAVLRNCWLLRGVAVGLAFSDGAGERVDLILFRDRVPPDSWRRLAVRLRHDLRRGTSPGAAARLQRAG